MSFAVPDDRYYSETHEWYNSDTGRVGLTPKALDEINEINMVDLPEVNESYEAGEGFCVIEGMKSVHDVHLPVGGTITEVNEVLSDEPQRITEDPYGEGWLVEIEQDSSDETRDLIDPDEYRNQL